MHGYFFLVAKTVLQSLLVWSHSVAFISRCTESDPVLVIPYDWQLYGVFLKMYFCDFIPSKEELTATVFYITSGMFSV